jgi:hypothetical protein
MSAFGRSVPVVKGIVRPKSGSRGRSDSGLTVDGDRAQGSPVEIEAMLEKKTSDLYMPDSQIRWKSKHSYFGGGEKNGY